MSVVLLILGLILFVGLVVVHEFGHFLVARRNGVEVEEFGIGFPPRAKAWRLKKDFTFSLNWLPIGGFVKLKGENDSDKRPGSLGAATTWVKAKIMLAGVGMNLVVAFVLLTGLAWAGMPQLVADQFTVKRDTKVITQQVLAGYVDAGSPAAKAGVRAQDRLQAIGSAGRMAAIRDAQALPALTKQYAGQTVQLRYSHKGVSHTATVTLRNAEAAKTKGALGIAPADLTLQRSTWSAPLVAAGLVKQFTVLTLQGLGTVVTALFHGDTAKASAQVSGPVGIVVILKDGSLLGYQFVLAIVALISLTLAIFNVLPIPALDGGRLFVILLSRLFGRKLSQQMEERIVGASFLLLIFLIILVTIVDVRRFF